MKFLNLTKKPVIVKAKGSNVEIVRPSGITLEVKTAKKRIASVEHMDAFQMIPTEVTGLPEKISGVTYLVDDPSIIMLTQRDDIISVDRQVYDNDGKIIIAIMDIDS